MVDNFIVIRLTFSEIFVPQDFTMKLLLGSVDPQMHVLHLVHLYYFGHLENISYLYHLDHVDKKVYFNPPPKKEKEIK